MIPFNGAPTAPVVVDGPSGRLKPADPAAPVHELVRRHAGGFALTRSVQYWLLHLYVLLRLIIFGDGMPRT